MKTPPAHITVAAAALIHPQGDVLLTQRPAGKPLAGLWEFPGGKQDAQESIPHTLIRELQEELGVEVALSQLRYGCSCEHLYPSLHVALHLFWITQWHGTPTAREHQPLHWCRIDQLHRHAMPEADVPLVAWLRDYHPRIMQNVESSH